MKISSKWKTRYKVLINQIASILLLITRSNMSKLIHLMINHPHQHKILNLYLNKVKDHLSTMLELLIKTWVIWWRFSSSIRVLRCKRIEDHSLHWLSKVMLESRIQLKKIGTMLKRLIWRIWPCISNRLIFKLMRIRKNLVNRSRSSHIGECN